MRVRVRGGPGVRGAFTGWPLHHCGDAAAQKDAPFAAVVCEGLPCMRRPRVKPRFLPSIHGLGSLRRRCGCHRVCHHTTRRLGFRRSGLTVQVLAGRLVRGRRRQQAAGIPPRGLLARGFAVILCGVRLDVWSPLYMRLHDRAGLVRLRFIFVRSRWKAHPLAECSHHVLFGRRGLSRRWRRCCCWRACNHPPA